MKKQLLILAVGAMTFAGCQAQSENTKNPEMKKIEQTVHTFSQAGDSQDAEKLDDILDDNYRIVMNRLFGSSEVSVMSKSVYLDKIKIKEFGGDKREVTINEIILNNNIATAKATFKGEKSTFISNLQLIQNAEGDWKIVSDIPFIK